MSQQTIRLTMAQAVARFLAAQWTEVDGEKVRLFGGVFAIFGHGNVAGVGEALYQIRDQVPTYRAHNEQGMAHAAIAFAKQMRRRHAMICTSSIGPGATNMVTAAALAYVNRLPVLFLGHGSPMNAITENEFRRSWQALGTEFGKAYPRPQLIVCISAHWISANTRCPKAPGSMMTSSLSFIWVRRTCFRSCSS